MTENGAADQPASGRMSVRPTTIARVASHVEADLIVGLLQSNDIYAYTSSDDAGGTYPGLVWVQVLVDAADAELALEVMEQTPGGGPN